LEFEKWPNKKWKTEEILCKEHFEKLTSRDETELYFVKLP